DKYAFPAQPINLGESERFWIKLSREYGEKKFAKPQLNVIKEIEVRLHIGTDKPVAETWLFNTAGLTWKQIKN
ncbi:MAG: hypothetical protein FWE89_04945, partial [Syntrophaceae bacterium]|nr:hypothetical protein [Syntrophaceae bacterium]